MGSGTFRDLTSVRQALRLAREHLGSRRTERELVPLDQAVGRVVSAPVQAETAVPHFPRSTMDGYAVRAADTFSASVASPALLRLVGGVQIGQVPELVVSAGQAAEIPTGGMLPAGADAVIMLEYVERIGEDTLQAFRPVAPGQHVQQVGEDVPAGQQVLAEGTVLTSGQIALLATLGHTGVEVHRRPRVAIISTGDEIVPAEVQPAPGQTRDSNAYGLAALCRQCGAEPVRLGIVPDEPETLRKLAEKALRDCDLLTISAGSSAGARDITLEVIEQLGAPGVFVNGLALRPGKPTIIADCEGKLAFGLPGHPTSALVVFHRLVRPVLAWLAGAEPHDTHLSARATRSIPSEPGLAEYVRVRTRWENGEWLAEPLFSKSASLTALAHADGLIEIGEGIEGLEAGEVVQVILWS